MINSLKNTATTEDSLGSLISKAGNPYWQLYRDYVNSKITVGELHRVLRTKLLKSVRKMKRQKYPLKPSEEKPANMEGWARACARVKAINIGNKHWLGILLSDLLQGKLKGEQGKIEEIQELLSEYPGYIRKETRIAINV